MRIAYFSLEFPPRIFGGLGVYVDEISKKWSPREKEYRSLHWETAS